MGEFPKEYVRHPITSIGPSITRALHVISSSRSQVRNICLEASSALSERNSCPAIFENYVAEIQLDGKHVQLALWDTACVIYNFLRWVFSNLRCIYPEDRRNTRYVPLRVSTQLRYLMSAHSFILSAITTTLLFTSSCHPDCVRHRYTGLT